MIKKSGVTSSMIKDYIKQEEMKKRKRKKIIIRTILIIFLILIILLGFWYTQLHTQLKKTAAKTYTPINRSTIPSNEPETLEEPFTVLVMGIEDYMDDVARTDVLIFNVVNPKSKEIAMVTIPRDAYVYLESRGLKDKINHAYVFGGLEDTLKTVYNLMEIPIDYYVSTNFNGFTDLVDAVDSVDVNIPFTFEAKMVDPSEWKTFEEGPAHLNGREALAYVRMRKTDPEGDFGRSKRQKEVIQAVVKKAVSLNGVTKINDILRAIGDNVQTNISYDEYLSFVQLGKDLLHANIDNIQLEGEGGYIGEIWYYFLNEENVEKVTTHLKEMMSHTDPSQATTFQERIEKEEAEQSKNPNMENIETDNFSETKNNSN